MSSVGKLCITDNGTLRPKKAAPDEELIQLNVFVSHSKPHLSKPPKIILFPEEFLSI